MEVAVILITSIAILLIGFLTAISSRDLVRLLIALELMFGSVFLALIPLFSISEFAAVAFAIAVITIFTSSGELLVLITSIIILDKKTKTIVTDTITIGGDKV